MKIRGVDIHSFLSHDQISFSSVFRAGIGRWSGTVVGKNRGENEVEIVCLLQTLDPREIVGRIENWNG